MNRQEEELLTALRAEFAVEAVEHLRAITDGLMELEKGSNPDRQIVVLDNICRQIHSLKGESRAVNFKDIEILCHALESVLLAWKPRGSTPSPDSFDTLHEALDSIRTMLATEGAMGQRQRDEVVAKLAQLSTAPGAVPAHPTRPEPAHPEPDAVQLPAEGGETRPEETVRIPLARLETLLLQLEEMLEVKLTMIQRADALRAAVALSEQGKRQAAKINAEIRLLEGAQTGQAAILDEVLERHKATVSTLGDTLASLALGADQDAHAVSLLVDNLLGQSKRLLMLPFNTLLGMLPRLVRDLCRDQGKDAEIVIRGGDIEIDKRILQELKDAVIHLIRNCVDHGIETVAVREQKNKPGRGTITVEILPLDAGKVELVIRDDGAGIDVEAVKKAAVKLGVISAASAAHLSRDMALSLIFQSSVSTSKAVTAVSGRGLGMAIVKERVEALGGRVTVETSPTTGSTFRITLPLTLTTFRGTFVDAAGQWFILPSASVDRVARVRRDQITIVDSREELSLDGHTFGFVGLADILGLPLPGRPATASKPLVSIGIVGVGDKRIALGFDEVLNEQEVLVKSFMKPLSRVRNVAGATVLASGRLVPILNVADLLKSAAALTSTPAAHPLERQTARLLVVEDSIISRMLFKSILESAGYGVKTAVDGEGAWEAMEKEHFDAVVSDIDMPRLNGLELTYRIRHDKRFGATPVILVTALSSPEDRTRGFEVGADAYIVKSSFEQSDLLNVLRRLV
ncbi:MAG: response regulator [bacterium]